MIPNPSFRDATLGLLLGQSYPPSPALSFRSGLGCDSNGWGFTEAGDATV